MTQLDLYNFLQDSNTLISYSILTIIRLQSVWCFVGYYSLVKIQNRQLNSSLCNMSQRFFFDMVCRPSTNFLMCILILSSLPLKVVLSTLEILLSNFLCSCNLSCYFLRLCLSMLVLIYWIIDTKIKFE